MFHFTLSSVRLVQDSNIVYLSFENFLYKNYSIVNNTVINN